MRTFITATAFILALASCRTGDEDIVLSQEETLTGAGEASPAAMIKGFFLLNEGNMGSNKATLDYYDCTLGRYIRNIYAEANPTVVQELGDVGNDIGLYGTKLYAVINCSHFVEVMNATDARHITQVAIPNCRYVVFDGGYAYVSSYAGPVGANSRERLGYVAKIDTASLKVVGECTVGYQPDGMAVAGGKLYVANSGGYRTGNYDHTVSVVDLRTFTETKKISVGPNPNRIAATESGELWVSTRGQGGDQQGKTYIIDPQTDTVADTLDTICGSMAILGGKLYTISGQSGKPQYLVIDTKQRTIADQSFIKDGSEQQIRTPYGLAVNPENSDIYLTDAGDYVSPGQLYCFGPDGKKKWQVRTGDIPAHFAMTTQSLRRSGERPSADTTATASPYITRVIDYRPAPGQFVGTMPLWQEGDTQLTMNAKVLEAIGGNRRGLITLGGCGGYIIVGFDHTIPNVEGERDFRVLGNAFRAAATAEGAEGEACQSEPGVISVAYDANHNGQPDPNEWYEIFGSAHNGASAEPWAARAAAKGNDTATIRDYEITYTRPQQEPATNAEMKTYIPWTDNHGSTGFRTKNTFHTQSYWPQWTDAERLTFRGTRLPQNGINEGTDRQPYYLLYKFAYGYADNAPNADEATTIDIGWACDSQGRKVNLPGADFIKISTGVNQENAQTGESSTEVMGIEDLHIKQR